MGLATVSVRYVNPPGAGKKNGTIKTPENDMYLVPPHMLPQFTPGGSYEIQYSERPFNNQVYKTVVTVRQVGTIAPAAAQSTGGGRQTDDVTAERIFVCGALNAAIHSGQVKVAGSTQELVSVVQGLRSAWAFTFGGKPFPQQVGAAQNSQSVQHRDHSGGPQFDPELNDEVPF